MAKADAALDKIAIRETIEDYLNFLDAKDWDGIASCFTRDSQSWYNFEPDVLRGGRRVADWLRGRVGKYGATDHALSNLHIVLDGDIATCDSRLTASLLYEEGSEQRVAVRAIWYRDKLRREGDRWLISERRHEPQWQYDLPTHALRL
jgi:ketosteroid isomerase-like protein